VLCLLEEKGVQLLVEIGTARSGEKFKGDGGSTILFGDWAKENGATLYTVDLLPEAIELAKSVTSAYADHIVYVCGDSVAFFAKF